MKKTSFTQEWFKYHINKAVRTAGTRYTPELNIDLSISEIFDGLGRTKLFFDRLKRHYAEIKRTHDHTQAEKAIKAAGNYYEQMKKNLEKLFSILIEIDPLEIRKIDFENIAELTEKTKEATWKCIEALRKGEEKKSNSTNPYDSEIFSHEKYHLYKLSENLQELNEFANSTQAKLANTPFLLLTGNAGIGKTHLFCDVAKHRIDLGLPTILLFGEKFNNAEPWHQIINLLKIDYKNKKELLDALNEEGKAHDSRAVIFIDALNEGQGRALWKRYISKIINDIRQYLYIGFAVSIRSVFEKSVMTENQINSFVKEEHYGFRFKEWEAVSKFFKEFNLKLPDIPLLTPEFQNPLFLKLFCKTYEGQERITRGNLGGTKIYEDYVIKMGHKICEEFGLPKGREYNGKNIFWDLIIKKIAECMGEKGIDRIHSSKIIEIVEEVLPGKSKEILDSMEKNWLLTKIPRYNKKGGIHSYIYRFPYNKFSDHLITRYLLNNHLEPYRDNPSEAFRRSKKLRNTIENSWNQGLIEALSIQVPERLKGTELVEITPQHFVQSDTAQDAFLESLIWRDLSLDKRGNSKFIRLKAVLKYIYDYIIRSEYGHNKFLNVLLTVASIPEHPLNADFLHLNLMQNKLNKRDSWWSTFLHDQYGERDAVDRLIEWAWSETPKTHISDESIRLCSVALAWFLTTSNRYLRDRATKGLVSLLTDRLHLIKQLLNQFKAVDDPYVLERLYAVAYGSALRNSDNNGLRDLAQYIYEQVFNKSVPPPHILLRDYARGVIEVALHRKINLKIDEDKIKPSYKSNWPENIPTKEELKKRYDKEEYWHIWDSVMESGDFARYIIGTNWGDFNWSSRRLGEPRRPTKKEQYENFIANLTKEQKELWDRFHPTFDIDHLLDFLKDDHLRKDFKNIDKKKLKEEQERAKADFKKTLSDKQIKIYKEVIIPYEKSPKQYEFQFDLSLAQCWIFQRVIDLGWTPELFQKFDKNVSPYGRVAHEPERIGKKYQWIAYHEFLAMVSDNFEFKEDILEDKPGIYEGPWQLSVRDIDPSCLLRSKPKYDNKTDRWRWFSIPFDAWEFKKEDKEWLKIGSDLPNPKNIIEIMDNISNKHWLVLAGLFRWEQGASLEERRYDIPTRSLWYMIKSYIVKKSDLEKVFSWAEKQNFMRRWMPESREFYKVFLREYPWAKAFLYFNTPYSGRAGWTRGRDKEIPAEVLVTNDEYLKESATQDCSVDDSINIQLPAKWIIDNMKLQPTIIDSEYKDSNGNIIAFDPCVKSPGPSALLINKDKFINFLYNQEYDIFWTILGKKNIIGANSGRRRWQGRLELSGAYRFVDGSLKGTMKTK